MQTPEEIVKVWYPRARIVVRGGETLVVAPLDGESYCWLSSKGFAAGTLDDVLWKDAHLQLVERAKVLIYNYEIH